MKYTQTYDVNRRMHLRPCAQVLSITDMLGRKYKGLRVTLENERNGSKVEANSILSYVFELHALKGDRIKITLEGDIPEAQLRESADEIGKTFSLFEEIPVFSEDLRKLENFLRNLK